VQLESSRDRAKSALQALTDSLAADGYTLDVAQGSPLLKLIITASQGACEECLVPKAMMKKFVRLALQEHGIAPEGDIAITYPAGHHES